MMNSLFLALFSLILSATHQVSLNVKDFGARGDGLTDDTQAINQALSAAHKQARNLYFPAGTYLCNTLDADQRILHFDAGGLSDISLYGDGDSSRITTSLNTGSMLLYIWAYMPDLRFTIKSLFFENTHGMVTSLTAGLFLQGTKGRQFTNVLISQCRFEGFGNAIGGQGVSGWTITQNKFGSPRGHDNAKNDVEPAVYCWFADNEQGYCTDVTITNNLADGYTGTGPITDLVTKRAMDGFVYGTGYRFTITGNTTRNFSEEHYALAPQDTFPDSVAKVKINGNYIDCVIPPGSMDNDTKKHRINYGIRCDINNAVITNNEIHNYTYGIMVRGVEYPQKLLHNYRITGNKLYAADDTVNYDVQAAISIQGNAFNTIKNIVISDNEIHAPTLRSKGPFRGIELFDMEKGVIQNNHLYISDSNKLIIDRIHAGIIYARVRAVRSQSNQIVGIKFRSSPGGPKSGQLNTGSH
jgi:hypothetical protein